MIYASSKIIPLQYRSINALRYIYDLMSTSDFEIKLAIDLYDRNEQRKLDSARLYEQQQANQLANEQNVISKKQKKMQILLMLQALFNIITPINH